MVGGEIKSLTSICKKLTPQELNFVLCSSNEKLHSLIGDILYNCCLNESVFSTLKKNKQFKNFKSSLASNKEDILKILKSRSKHQRKKMIKKQVGTGVVTIIASLLAGVLPLLFSKK